MSDVDLTCGLCEGTGAGDKNDPRYTKPICPLCGGTGRRLPTLGQWDNLRRVLEKVEAERDRYREELEELAETVEDEPGYALEVMSARAVLERGTP